MRWAENVNDREQKCYNMIAQKSGDVFAEAIKSLITSSYTDGQMKNSLELLASFKRTNKNTIRIMAATIYTNQH